MAKVSYIFKKLNTSKAFTHNQLFKEILICKLIKIKEARECSRHSQVLSAHEWALCQLSKAPVLQVV